MRELARESISRFVKHRKNNKPRLGHQPLVGGIKKTQFKYRNVTRTLNFNSLRRRPVQLSLEK
jgi:hypothetical protein